MIAGNIGVMMMCDKFCNCDYCGYDGERCQLMGDGSPFCRYFICIESNCNRSECISEFELFFDS